MLKKLSYIFILAACSLNANTKFNDILKTISNKIATKKYITVRESNSSSYQFMQTTYLTIPSVAIILKQHFNNPYDVSVKNLKAFCETEEFTNELVAYTLSEPNYKFSSAIHEAAHLLMYRNIIELDYKYSYKILKSLKAEIKAEKTSLARTYSFEPNILFTKKEILLRMKMLLAGQIAQKYIIDDNQLGKEQYLKKNKRQDNDISKWYWYAKRWLKLNSIDTKLLLKKQEEEVLRYLQNNITTLYELAEPLYNSNYITNKKIISIFNKNRI